MWPATFSTECGVGIYVAPGSVGRFQYTSQYTNGAAALVRAMKLRRKAAPRAMKGATISRSTLKLLRSCAINATSFFAHPRRSDFRATRGRILSVCGRRAGGLSALYIDTPINGLGKLAVLIGFGGTLDHALIVGISNLAKYLAVVASPLSTGLALRGVGEVVYYKRPMSWPGVSVAPSVAAAAYRGDPGPSLRLRSILRADSSQAARPPPWHVSSPL
jgi:hypothetical protein